MCASVRGRIIRSRRRCCRRCASSSEDTSSSTRQANRMDTSPQQADKGRMADHCIMVIFGASGDLTTRMLLPALYNPARNPLLPEEFAILGFAKDEFSEDDFRKHVREDLHAYA